MPTPSFNEIYKGSYKTMLEQLSSIEGGTKSPGIDEDFQSLNGKSPPYASLVADTCFHLKLMCCSTTA